MQGRVLITRRILDKGLEILSEAGCRAQTAQPDGNAALAREQLLERIINADALLCHLSDTIDREVLETNPDLLGIANFAVGYDNIDIGTATKLGIPVSNTPDVLTETTADLTWGLLLAVTRQIPAAHHYTVNGDFRIWNPVLFLGDDVGPGGSGRHKTLGVIGFGRIGRAVARRAEGFSLKILAHDPGCRAEIEASPAVRWSEMDELLRTSEFVTLHTPLTPQTRHLIGAREFELMKPSAYLINVARGPIVDEIALVRALREGQIRGAALDVYEAEPELAPGLLDLPNVVLTPHIGSATRETRNEMAAIAARNTIAHLRGEQAPEAVNPEVYATTAWQERVRRGLGRGR